MIEALGHLKITATETIFANRFTTYTTCSRKEVESEDKNSR